MAKADTVKNLSGAGKCRRYRAVVVCDGNSLTQGTGGTSYPTQLAALYPSTILVINTGISGQTTQEMSATATDVRPFISAAVPSVVVAWEVRNDLYHNASVTAAQAVANLWTYCQSRRAEGAKVVAVNVSKCTTPASNLSAQDITDANAAIATDYASYADRLVDVGGIAELQNPADTNYFTDGVHMTTAGYALVANAVLAAIPSVSAMRML